MDTENQDPMLEEETVVETHEEWALRKRREAMNVTRFQAKAALMQAGLLDDIEQAVSDSDDPMIKLAWQESSFVRLSPLISAMAGAVGLSDEQLDRLFESAMGVA
jgi:hypothetical protein